MTAFEHWPDAMTIKDMQNHAGLSRDDAYKILRNPAVLVMPKRRNKQIGKYMLLKIINGGKYET